MKTHFPHLRCRQTQGASSWGRSRSQILWMVGVLCGALLGGIAASAPVQAQQYSWTNDVPERLKGTWVLRGERCEDPNSQLAIFSDGGYRWRKSRTDWGFARGKYSYNSPVAGTVYFRLQRFLQNDKPDFSITISGPELRKYSFGSSELYTYDKCRQ